MVHTRPPTCSHHWHLSTCTTVAPRLGCKDLECRNSCLQPPRCTVVTSHMYRWQNGAKWFPALWIPYEAPAWQAICNRCWHADCHLLVTDTSHQFHLCQHTFLGAMTEQTLEHSWLQCRGMMCTTCHPYAKYTSKYKKISPHQSLYLIFLNSSEHLLCSAT
jgi:hypothetical protein